VFALATKGQKFKSYSHETKLKAITMKQEGKTKRQIMEELGIEDEGQIKIWMRKYKQLGEYGLMDSRGRREEYIDEERHTQKLQRENEMLKKCLEIWWREVRRADTKS
jgi:transposase